MPRALMLGVAVPGEGSEGGFVLKRCRAAFEAEKLPPVQGQAALPRIRHGATLREIGGGFRRGGCAICGESGAAGMP